MQVAQTRHALVVAPRTRQRTENHVPEAGREAVAEIVVGKVVVEMVAARRLEIPRPKARVEEYVRGVHDDLSECDAAVDAVRGLASEQHDSHHHDDDAVHVRRNHRCRDDA